MAFLKFILISCHLDVESHNVLASIFERSDFRTVTDGAARSQHDLALDGLPRRNALISLQDVKQIKVLFVSV